MINDKIASSLFSDPHDTVSRLFEVWCPQVPIMHKDRQWLDDGLEWGTIHASTKAGFADTEWGKKKDSKYKILCLKKKQLAMHDHT